MFTDYKRKWKNKVSSNVSIAKKHMRKLKILPLKIEIFQIKNCDIFLTSAQNIDCGYSLEPHQRGGSN